MTITMDKDTAANHRLAMAALERKIDFATSLSQPHLTTLQSLYDNINTTYQEKTVKKSTSERNKRTLKKLIQVFGTTKYNQQLKDVKILQFGTFVKISHKKIPRIIDFTMFLGICSVQLTGLEPEPTCVDMNLNHARMPIPPQLLIHLSVLCSTNRRYYILFISKLQQHFQLKIPLPYHKEPHMPDLPWNNSHIWYLHPYRNFLRFPLLHKPLPPAWILSFPPFQQ